MIMAMNDSCVACGSREGGNDHHCSAEYENRREAAEKVDRDGRDYRTFGGRLEDGFQRLEGL